MSITPYSIHSGSVSSTKSITWRMTNAAGELIESDQVVHAVDATGVFELSFIACAHPEGKSWESIFIPLNKTGLSGLNITWWNRKRGLPGQINVKLCSQSEFYDTVASKAVYKGYEVLSFIGRDKPITRRHSFVEELHQNLESVTPPLAANTGMLLPSLQETGEIMAQNGLDLAPIANFFAKLHQNGLIESAVMQADNQANSGNKLVLKAFLDTLINEGEGMFQHSTRIASEDPMPKAALVPKEERYDTWGVFG